MRGSAWGRGHGVQSVMQGAGATPTLTSTSPSTAVTTATMPNLQKQPTLDEFFNKGKQNSGNNTGANLSNNSVNKRERGPSQSQDKNIEDSGSTVLAPSTVSNAIQHSPTAAAAPPAPSLLATMPKNNDSQGSPTSSYEEVQGDLMTATDSALCHCVSACMAMGKGIAVLFKQNFGGVDELKAQRVDVGGMAILNRPTTTQDKRFIYYLVTKPRYFDKPTYATLTASITAMRDHAVANGVQKLAMPELGCGLDGLQWPQVSSIVQSIFAKTEIHVTVYHFKPVKQYYSHDFKNKGGRGRGGSS